MQFGQISQAGAAARRMAGSGPLAVTDHVLDASAGPGAGAIGNALSQVTGGQRPHRAAAVATATQVALRGRTTVIEVASEVPVLRARLALAAVLGGSGPYQVSAVTTATAG